MPRKRKIDDHAVQSLLQRDERVVTRQALTEVGLPPATVSHRVRPEGPWQTLLPGVVVTHDGQPTGRERLLAALRYTPPGSVITGVAALRLLGLRKLPATTIVAVLIDHTRHRKNSGYVMTERTTRLPTPVDVRGIPCAPIPRAAIDASRRLRDRQEIRAITAEAVQRGLCTPAALMVEVRAGASAGSALPRQVVGELRRGIRSVAEADARDCLVRASCPEPRWNVDLYDEHGRWLACVDGWYDEVAVALEIDSQEYHLDPVGWKRTLDRHERMTRLGILVLHMPPSRVHTDPAGFVAAVEDTLAAASRRARPAVHMGPPRRAPRGPAAA